jgi:hypothetical protein
MGKIEMHDDDDFDTLDVDLHRSWQHEDDPPPCRIDPLTPWHEEENWQQDLHLAINRLQVELEERRKEYAVIQDMHDRIVTLEDEVSRLPKSGSIIVPITTFDPEPFGLVREIKVVVEASDDEFIASFFDANLNAQGCNQQEAFENLKETLVSRFDYLDTLDPMKLGPVPAKQIAILRTYIRRSS